jgi:hypothetical protein
MTEQALLPLPDCNAPAAVLPPTKKKAAAKPRANRKVTSTRNVDAKNAIARGEFVPTKAGRPRMRKELEGNKAATVEQSRRQSVKLTNAAASLRTTTGSTSFSVSMYDEDNVIVYADSHTRSYLSRRAWAEIIEAVVRGHRDAELCDTMPPGDFKPLNLPGISGAREWPFFDTNAVDPSVPFAYAALVPVTGLSQVPMPWQAEDTVTEPLELPPSQKAKAKAQRRLSGPAQPPTKTNQRRTDSPQLISVGARINLPEPKLSELLPFSAACVPHPKLLAVLNRPRVTTGGRWGTLAISKCFV